MKKIFILCLVSLSLSSLPSQTTTTTPNNFVFPRIREWGISQQAGELRKFCIEIGIRSEKSTHCELVFATHLLSNGLSRGCCKVAGWKDLDTMQGYMRLAGIYEKGQQIV